MPRINSFPPIEDSTAKVLILGSMPSKASLIAGQYYAHHRNSFWSIMGDLISAPPTLPYASRIQILKCNGIALWDVLASCSRESSLDSDIDKTSASPNDIRLFLSTHPNIRNVFFNGTMAEKFFYTFAQHKIDPKLLQYKRLPSTSPANASLSYYQKLDAWKTIIQVEV